MDSQYIDLTLDEMNVRRVGAYLVCLMRSKNDNRT